MRERERDLIRVFKKNVEQKCHFNIGVFRVKRCLLNLPFERPVGGGPADIRYSCILSGEAGNTPPPLVSPPNSEY